MEIHPYRWTMAHGGTGPRHPFYAVFLDEPGFIEAYGLREYAPVIDFQHEVLVVAHRGPCPSAGYGVGLAEASLERGALIIKVSFEDPAPGVVTAAVITYPRAFGLIERSLLPESLDRMATRFVGPDGKVLTRQRGVPLPTGRW